MNVLQESMWASHGFQCGFCTPGFMMQATVLSTEDPEPDRGRGARLPSATCADAPATNQLSTASSWPPVEHQPSVMSAPIAQQVNGTPIRRSEDCRRGEVERVRRFAGLRNTCPGPKSGGVVDVVDLLRRSEPRRTHRPASLAASWGQANDHTPRSTPQQRPDPEGRRGAASQPSNPRASRMTS
jgi:hypothetical protein